MSISLPSNAVMARRENLSLDHKDDRAKSGEIQKKESIGFNVQLKAGAISMVTARRIMARSDSAKSVASVGAEHAPDELDSPPGSPRGVATRVDSAVRKMLLDIKARLDDTRMRTIDIFRDIDKSGDGRISVEEFLGALKNLGFKPSKEEAVLLVSRLDRDRSGDIDVKELDRGLRLVEKQQTRPTFGGRQRTGSTIAIFENREDTVLGLLQVLKKQSAELRERSVQEDKLKLSEEWREAAESRSRFVGGEPWLRPSCSPRAFAQAGNLPASYLEPLEAARSSMPRKNYEPQPEVPFRYANSNPRVFDEPDVPERPKLAVPLFHGDSKEGAGPEMKMAPRPSFSGSPPQRTPRSTRLMGDVTSSQASPIWKTSVGGLPSVGAFLPRLEERIPQDIRSARTDAGAPGARCVVGGVNRDIVASSPRVAPQSARPGMFGGS